MTEHLLLIALGPVQDFIAQSRRTRDLWYGSHLISELARAAALNLTKNGARLVFPALNADDLELMPCLSTPLRATGKPPLSIANKLLAELPEGCDPAVVARSARAEMIRFWSVEVAGAVREKCSGLLADEINDVWNEQIDSLLEFTAAWAPINGDYPAARVAVESAVAGRKNLREFRPYTKQRGGVAKSSLDGARESILKRFSEADLDLVSKYRIAKGEQLDAVGLVKRAGGNPDQFVSVVNIALSCWIRLAAKEAPKELDSLSKACRDVGISRVRGDLSCTEHFQHDAEIFLPGRWKSISEQLRPALNHQAWGREHVVPLLKRIGEPVPYVACIVADGDNMGAAISSLRSAEDHRRFSRSLSSFADSARQIVERTHSGVLIYAGGDDVLAFLPLPEALACAESLRRRFTEIMVEAQLMHTELPTLSVGIGVGHVLESMGDLLALGRSAEKLAKAGRAGQLKRNALAVAIEKRSGSRRWWRARWDEWSGDPVDRLLKDSELLNTKLSTRTVYEVEKILRRLPVPRDGDGNIVIADQSWSRLLALEFKYCLSDFYGQDGGDFEKLGIKINQDEEYALQYSEISTWVDRLIVAQTFDAAIPKLQLSTQEAFV